MRLLTPALLALATLSPTYAGAQAGTGDPATDPACATVRVAIPPELSGWSERTDLTAGTTAALAPVLVIGKAATVALSDRPVRWAATPEKAPAAGTHGGLLQVEVRTAGTYRLALSDMAWIDVALRGHRVASSAHKMATKCSGVKKLVDFPLARGRYVIQLSGATKASIAAMLVRVK